MKRIGWKEMVDLPDWGIHNMLAKMDTGACGSAIDVKQVTEMANDEIEFEVVLHRKDRSHTHRIRAPLLRRTRIRSSNGSTHVRYVVLARIRVAGIEKEVEMSMVNRKRMICRMLLGRTALAGDFWIDPGSKYLGGNRRAPSIRAKPKPGSKSVKPPKPTN